MRILFYGGGSYIGGMERVLLTLMRGLQQQGHAVKIIISGWNDGHFPDMLREAGVPFSAVKLSRLTRVVPHMIDGLRNLPRAALQLRNEAIAFSPDVIVHVDVMGSLSALPFLPRKVCHVMHVHNLPGHDFDKAAGRIFLRKMDGFICVSKFIAGRLECLKTGRPVAFVHNGVDEAALPHEPTQRSGRVRFGIVGHLLPRKRHCIFFEAISLLGAATRARAEFLVIGPGDGKAADALQSQCRRLGIVESLRWTGWIRDKREIYKAIDVLVSPSIDEPFGMVVLEAALFGKPSILANSGGFPEVVQHQVTGILFEPDNTAELANAMNVMIDDREKVLAMGLAAQKFVSETFPAEAFCRKFALEVEQLRAAKAATLAPH